MSVTVRTMQTPPTPEQDSKIGWIDRPILVDIQHADGQSFTVQDGVLYVWKDDATHVKPIVIYAPGAWVFARTDATEAAP